MKRLYNYIVLATLSILSFTSCESDIEKIRLDNPINATASTLTSEGIKNAVPTNDNLKDFAVVYNWTRTLMGDLSIPVTYTILVDTTDQFTNPHEVDLGTNNLSRTVTYENLNDWALKFTGDFNNIRPLNLFVKIAGSVLTQNSDLVVPTDKVYSNYLTINVTPFVSGPAIIYLPGDYVVNGWTPAESPKLYSEKRDDVYSGYVYFNTQFKVTLQPNWDGGEFGGSSGTLVSKGDNIITTPGFYWVEVNMNDKTYTLTSTQIGIIGSIKGNWEQDLPMTYDPEKNILTITDTFAKGVFKFRRNANWDVNYGLGNDGSLVLGGDDIPLDISGKVTITLNLWDYLNPSFTVSEATN